MEFKSLVSFIMLHGSVLNNFGLMHGKMGCSLALYEFSQCFNNELAEKYAFELLQEVLAIPMKNNTFVEGKMGIAWSLIHLIKREYIDADYLELYGQEHKEIIDFIKQLRLGIDVASKSDAIAFLISSKSYTSKIDFDELLSSLIESLCGYLKLIPESFFDRNIFYSHASKILCCYNLYEELRCQGEAIIDTIVQTHRALMNDDYVCTNLSFGTNLLQYSISRKCLEIEMLANKIIDDYFSNLVVGTLGLKEVIDTIYNMDKLLILNPKSEWILLKKQLNNALLDEESHLYKESRTKLSSLKVGIPRLLMVECLNMLDLKSDGHYIMMQ